MRLTTIAKWSFSAIALVSGVVTILYALPVAKATYECNFHGRMCQYSLYGPSDKATKENIRIFEQFAVSKDARFTTNTLDLPNKAQRTDLFVLDGERQLSILSVQSEDIVSIAMTDDRRTALVVTGPTWHPKLRLFTFLANGLLADRQYEMSCHPKFEPEREVKSEVRFTNLRFETEKNVVSFDFDSNCETKTLEKNSNLYFGSPWKTSGRVWLKFDQDFFLQGAYPTVTWNEPPTNKELELEQARLDLITKQSELAEAVLKRCVNQHAQNVMVQNETNFFYVCEVPETLADQPTYWKIKNERAIVSGRDASNISTQRVGCDAENYTLRSTPNSPLLIICAFGRSEYQVAWLTFVDSDFHINNVKVACSCWQMQLRKLEVEPNAISFDVASSSPNFEFDGKPIVLGGPPHKRVVDNLAYRGRVTVAFFEGGWMRDVSFAPP